MAGTDQTARVVGVVTPLLAGLSLVLEDVTLTPAGKRRLVRVSLDRDTAGLDPDDHTSTVAPLSLDEVADATRAISSALDEAEPLGNTPYVLEVTSPGLGRPLTLPRHFRRNVGRLLELTLTDGTSVAGRLVAATPERLTVRTADGVRRELAFAEVTRARVRVEFGHPDDDPDDPDAAADDDAPDDDPDEDSGDDPEAAPDPEEI